MKIDVTIDDKYFDALGELLTILNAIDESSCKRVTEVYRAFAAAREKSDIRAGRCYRCHEEKIECFPFKNGEESKLCIKCECGGLDIEHPDWSPIFDKFDIPLVFSVWEDAIKEKMEQGYEKAELKRKPWLVFAEYLRVM